MRSSGDAVMRVRRWLGDPIFTPEEVGRWLGDPDLWWRLETWTWRRASSSAWRGSGAMEERDSS